MIQSQYPSFIKNYFDECNIKLRQTNGISVGSHIIAMDITNIFISLPTNIRLDAIVKDRKILSIIEDGEQYNRNVPNKYSSLFNELDALLRENVNNPLIFKPLWKNGLVRNIYNLNAIDAITTNSLCVVTSAAGGGKSILLQFLTLYLIANLESQEIEYKKYSLSKQLLDEDLIPLYVPLVNLINNSNSEDGQFPSIKDLLKCLFGEDADEDKIVRFFKQKDTIFLFDGVDEISNGNKRELIIRRLVLLAKTITKKARIVFSARDEIGYNWIPREFVQFELTGMNAELRKHLSIRTLSELGYSINDAETRTYSLLKDIDASQLDYELIDSPLFFSLLIHIFIEGEKLPSYKSVLLGESIKLLIDRWLQRTQKNSPNINSNKTKIYNYSTFREILEATAYNSLICNYSLSQKSLEFSEAFLTDSIIKVLSLKCDNGEHILDIKNIILSCLVGSIGIIKEGSLFSIKKTYRFSHRTFQVFLAANMLSVSEFYKNMINNLLFETPWNYENVLIMLIEIMHDKGEVIVLYNLVIKILDYFKDTHVTNYKELHTWLTWYMTKIISSRNYALLSNQSLRYYYRLDKVLTSINTHVIKTLESKFCRMANRVFCARYLCILPNMIKMMHLKNEFESSVGQLGDRRYGIGVSSEKIPEIEWCTIKGGTFNIGLSKKELSYFENLYPDYSLEREIPSCEINVLPFVVSKYPITNLQYKTFCDAGAYLDSNFWAWSNVSKEWFNNVGNNKCVEAIFDNTDNSPVVNISWIEAKAFCEWLSNITGRSIRLPYEHEWEYVSKRMFERYSITDEFDDNIYVSERSQLQKPAPVGIYPYPYNMPSDLNGNIWEWTQTRIDGDEGLSHFSKDLLLLPRNAYDTLSIHTMMVLRGGCFLNSPFMLRNTYRGRDYIYNHISNRHGFRLVYDL